MKLKRGFWTAYRRFFVETLLARGESPARIAGKLGVEPWQLRKAIYNHGLKPRELLEARDG